MKKRILAIVLILSLVMSMMPGMAFASTTAQNYELRTLTFEDSDYKGGQNFAGGTNWTSLVDSNQYGGPLLYGSEGMGYANTEEAYYWHDKGNTELTSRLSAAYGSYCFWSGGHAISNYVSGDYATNGTYENQLTVYKEGVEGIAKAGGGYNGSDNFAIHYGYIDGSEYNMTEYLPSFSFADGTARVIDHMYVNGTAYFLNCVYNGNELTEKVKEGDYVYLEATGYNGETKTESVQLPIVDGPNRILKDWTKWDLSGLGEVTKVEFNVCGSSDNGFGFSQAAYFAYDNVAVRFPKESPVVPTDLKLDKETAELNVGDSLKLNAVVEPEDAQTDTITWSSTDETVAKVENGTVTALAAGKATIKAEMGELSDTCEITVVKVNRKPVLKEGVSATKTDVVPASYGYSLKELQNNEVFEDPDGDQLAYTSYYYERSKDGGKTWSSKQNFPESDFGDTMISLMEREEGTYMYRFYAYDGQVFSDDTYTITLHVSNEATLDFTFHVGQDYSYDKNTQPNYPIIKLYKTAGTDAAAKDYVGWYEKEDGTKVYIYNPEDHVIAGDAETGYTADGYALKGYAPITFTDSFFGGTPAEEETATASGTLVGNYNMFYASIPVGKYSYRAYGYNTETGVYDVYLGGQQLILPTETNVDGGTGGGTDIYIGTYSSYTTSKKADGTYFTEDEYDVEIMMPKMECQVQHGDAYKKGNYAYYPFAIYLAGNAALFNVKAVPKIDGYMFNQVGNQAKAASYRALSGTISISQKLELSVTVPENADFGLYFQWNNFNTEEMEAVKTTKDEAAGTKTISYAISANASNYTWRLTDTNGEYVTKAGWLDKYSSNSEMTLSFDRKDKKSHDFSELGTAVSKRDEGDIQVFVDDSGFMSTTDTYRARAYRMWEIINSDTANIMIEPDFQVQVLSGKASDVVKVNGNNGQSNWLDVTPTTTDIIAVNYDALDVDKSNNASHGGFFPATNPERTNVFVMTNEAAGTADAHIRYNSDSENNSRSPEWDYNYDTWFYMNTDKAPSLDFTVEGTGDVEVSYATVTTDASLKSTLSDWKDVTVGEDGACKIDLTSFRTANTKGGTVIIKMTDSTGTSYRLARVAEMAAAFENVNNPGEPFMPGDEVKVTFDGLYRSINKIAGIFNPTTYYLRYYDGTSTVNGTLPQYNKMDNASIQFTIPEDLEMDANGEAQYTFTNGYVYGAMFAAADPFRSMYYITDSGVGTNFNAVSVAFCLHRFADLTVDVVEKVVYDVNLNVTDGEKTLTDVEIHVKAPDGTAITPDENGIYQDLEFGEYEYTAKAGGFLYEYGTFKLGIADKENISDGIVTKTIQMTKAGEKTWNGETMTAPQKDENGVYQIGTGAELAWFAALVNGTLPDVTADPGASAVLTDDIDLGRYEWTPIGTDANPYSGTFDGKGHTIKNLSIRYYGTTTASVNKGLFYQAGGTADAHAVIKNFTLEGSMMLTSTGNVSNAQAAAVVAVAKYLTIENVHTNVDITIDRVGGNWTRVAGVVGYATDDVVITNCSNAGDITAYNYAAGILGYGTKDTVSISGCANTGNIKGYQYIAGITGYHYGLINSCYNTGDVTSGSNNIAGIVGYLNGAKAEVSNCFNLGDVVSTGTSTSYIGSLIGRIYSADAVIENLYYLDTTNKLGIGSAKNADTQTATVVTTEDLPTAAFAEAMNKSLETPMFVMDTNHPILLWQVSPEKMYKVTLPENEGYTLTGENSAKVAKAYVFTVEVAKGYHSGDDFAVKINENTVNMNEDGKYVLPFVTGDLVVTVEGIHALQYHKATASTCTESGNVEYYACSVCEKNYADEAGTIVLENIEDAADGHKMTYHKAVASTCTEAGSVAYYHCDICGNDYGDEAGKTKLNSVTDAADGHKMTYHKAVASTCTEAGSVAYYHCDICGNDYADEAGKTKLNSVTDAADGHKYTSKVVKPTTKGKGYTLHTCKKCKDNYKDTYTKQLLKAPTVKVSNVASSGKIKLTWNKVSNAEQYKVYRATKKNGKYTLMKTVKSTNYTNTSAKAGKTYYYKVKAVDANKKFADSAYSKTKKGICDLKRPVVTAKSKTKKQVKLTWKKVSGAKKYTVYRATSKNGKYTKIATTTKVSCIDKKLKSGKTYFYKVKAIAKDSAANSAYSVVDKCKVK